MSIGWRAVCDRLPMRRTEGGFSLLEMVVAMAILGMSLGVMYQATSGATRNLRIDERYAYATELARSLLADNARVPAVGASLSGETPGGFEWQLQAQPLVMPEDSRLPPGALQQLQLRVAWRDEGRLREVSLHSIVEGVPE